MSTVADRDRQRLCRARQAQGQIPVTVIVDEIEWVCTLVDAGFLTPNLQEDRRAIGRALSRMLDLLLRTNLADLMSRRDNS